MLLTLPTLPQHCTSFARAAASSSTSCPATASYRGREVLLAVRGFVIATGRVDSMGDPIALRTDRRGREIAARSALNHRW